MAIALVGTVVSSADAAGDFSTRNGGANISGDDDFVEGTGAVGDKMSNTTELLVSDNLAGGVAGLYDFSVGGADEGAHFIGWINTKTPINSVSGLGVYFRNVAGHFGVAYVMPASFYKGGFITRVWSPAADFDTATTWTTNGNPAQLDDVTEMGFQFTTITSIMGSFNNTQVDQMTVGFGVRADAGSSGTPNTFETVRAQDEDTSFWGWWSAANGAFVGKGKLYIGPAAGSTASWFVDSAFSVNFADENVAVGFYEFAIRGSNTTCSWTLANIQAANPASARWSLTLEATMGDTTGGFTDTNGTWVGSDAVALNANAVLSGTTIINGNSLSQLSATLTAVTVIGANRTSGQAYLLCDDINLLTDSDFQSGGSGHAVEYRPAGAGPFNVNWSGNTDSGYAATDGSTGDETLLIHPVINGADITLNVIDGSSVPTIMLHADYTGTFSLVVNPVTLSVNVKDNLGANLQNARVIVEAADGLGDLPFEESVTITRSGSTASVVHTGHGLSAGKKVVISGADQVEYNGVKTLSNVTVNGYDFTVSGTPTTPATGTIIATGAILEGLTDLSGNISDTRSYSVDQAGVGVARKGTNAPYFKDFPISVTVDKDAGAAINIQMVSDQ